LIREIRGKKEDYQPQKAQNYTERKHK